MPGTVRVGAAEAIPLADASQDVVFFENVLEHVDSPRLSLTEIFRVLKPGGIAYVTTTNRLRFSLVGRNDEYRVPFYNWAPKLVKESYVFLHLHYRPELANFTERPAVHWFSYADLCALGRDVGFSSFYSPLDCRRPRMRRCPRTRSSACCRVRCVARTDSAERAPSFPRTDTSGKRHLHVSSMISTLLPATGMPAPLLANSNTCLGRRFTVRSRFRLVNIAGL